ncbi:MAG: hypothetical protein GH150_04815 [Hadesarchaea archaeon]|nr:hypothetical protein [Hadesarchaea archaeon]
MSDLTTVAVVGFLAGVGGAGFLIWLRGKDTQLIRAAQPKMREVSRHPEIYGRRKLSTL